MREFGKKRPNSAIDFCWILIVSPCIYRGIVSLIINDENRSIDLSIWTSIDANFASINRGRTAEQLSQEDCLTMILQELNIGRKAFRNRYLCSVIFVYK